MTLHKKKKYVLVIPDGGADTYRSTAGKSPLGLAEIKYADFIAREGVTGLMQTLYTDLPKESLVAQLGMLGWDPYIYYPNGRASAELLALDNIYLEDGDLAFRANFVRMEGRILASYNADYITSEQSRPIVQRINNALSKDFPDFELYHNSDFRNCLIVRGMGVRPEDLHCPEPHESHGLAFDVEYLISTKNGKSERQAHRINRYLAHAAKLLKSGPANMIFPWSPSRPLRLVDFKENTGFKGKVAIVGCMDFLHGIAKAGGLDFFKVGNGRPDTDYRAKGARLIELLLEGYEFVICHINAPDEASHMGDLALKIRSLELVDDFVLRPLVEYFQNNSEELGGVMIVPDHYSNHAAASTSQKRIASHSDHPVPFAIWNQRERDVAQAFSEDDVLAGKYGKAPVNHLELLRMLGVKQSSYELASSNKR
jgi:2,3-bisphosphoglycerate-independent phosphoglycerate mutase